jgi:hypothetical protein
LLRLALSGGRTDTVDTSVERANVDEQSLGLVEDSADCSPGNDHRLLLLLDEPCLRTLRPAFPPMAMFSKRLSAEAATILADTFSKGFRLSSFMFHHLKIPLPFEFWKKKSGQFAQFAPTCCILSGCRFSPQDRENRRV